MSAYYVYYFNLNSLLEVGKSIADVIQPPKDRCLEDPSKEPASTITKFQRVAPKEESAEPTPKKPTQKESSPHPRKRRTKPPNKEPADVVPPTLPQMEKREKRKRNPSLCSVDAVANAVANAILPDRLKRQRLAPIKIKESS